MSEWREVTLGDVADVVGGGTPSTRNPAYWGDGVVWLTPGEVTRQEGKVIHASERQITPAGLANSSATLLPEHTVLLTSRATVGAVALAGQQMATNQGFQSLIARDGVLPRFLMCWVQGNRVEFQLRASGSTFPEISGKKIRSIPISVPPLHEQRRIVDLITSVDATVEALSAEHTTTHHALGAARRDLGKAHHRVRLADLADDGGIQIGPFGSQLHAHEYTESEDGIPVVMPQDLIDGQVTTHKIKRVPPGVAARLGRHRLAAGDVVFPRRGDLAKRALVTQDQAGWLCGTGCLRFRPKHPEEGERLFEALAAEAITEWLRDKAVGTTMPNLNTEILSALPVPSIDELSTLADSCIALGSCVRHLRNEISAVRALRSSLLSGLLSRSVPIPRSYDSVMGVAS